MAKQHVRAHEYRALCLMADKTTLPDPFTDLTDGWEGEDASRTKWPCTMITDISEYLNEHDTDIAKCSLRKRLLCDYKEGKAFSYYSSKFLFEVLYHP